MAEYHCSFCGKRREEVQRLISGPGVFICDKCTGDCLGIIEKQPQAAPRSRAGEVKPADAELRCTFCGKTRPEVAHLIAGGPEVAHPVANRSVYICDECVGLCTEIVEEGVELGRPVHDERMPLRD